MKKVKQLTETSIDLNNEALLLGLAERIRLRGNFITDHDNSADKVGNLRCMINELTDGRPKPFSVMEGYEYTLNHIKDPRDKIEREAELTFFGEVTDRQGISIGEFEFDLDETIKFRDWMNSAIEWMQKQKGNSDG